MSAVGVAIRGGERPMMGGKQTLTPPVLCAQLGMMLTVHTTPAVTAERSGGWELVFWLGEAFDYKIPFRAALAEMASALSQSKPTNIALPRFVEGEDFVEGQLFFSNTTIGIYYEYSLGYLSLTSENRPPLDEIKALTQPFVCVT